MEVDLSPHPVTGLVLQVGDAEKFPLALGFESLGHLFSVSKQGPSFTAIKEDEVMTGDNLNLLVMLMLLLHQIPFNVAIAATAEAIPVSYTHLTLPTRRTV